VQWRTATQETFPEFTQVAAYRLPAGTEWQDVSIQLPIQGNAHVIRLYLPTDKSDVEVQSIQYLDMNGRKKVWDFAGEKPSSIDAATGARNRKPSEESQ
jgi:hypothetical protein